MVVTVLIPCRNEEKYIQNCVQSVQKFILPAGTDLEILIIDGRSTDNTRDIIKRMIESDPRISLLDNPRLFQVSALNIGIDNAKGDFILRLDAHAIYPEDYLEKLYSSWIETKADCVGGVIATLPGGNTFEAELVQALTTHPFGVGNSSFRTSTSSGYRDTVPYGLFPKDVFSRFGNYNEYLVSGEDYEMSSRIRKNGGKIWQNGEVVIKYFNQSSLFKFYQKQFVREGHYNAYMWYLAPYTFALRHSLPGVFAAGFLGGIVLSFFSKFLFIVFIAVMCLYGVIAILSAIQQSLRLKRILFVILLPFCFLTFHLSYGFGILSGIIKLLLRISPVQNR